MSRFTIHNLVGHKSGRLSVVKFAGMRNGRAAWLCNCECGRTTTVLGHKLASGETKSCGCLRGTHGMARRGSRSPEYKAWLCMRGRCNDPKHISYKNYGGRGIKVCERWQKFENFYADMGTKPRGFILGRIDNNDNYAPDNCKWSTRSEQNHNARPKGRGTWRVHGKSHPVN